MIEGLPPDNAIARAQNGGREWTTGHALAWEILHLLANQQVLLNGMWNRKQKPKLPKWPKFPWSDTDKTKWGRVKKGDEMAAVQYLMGLHKNTNSST